MANFKKETKIEEPKDPKDQVLLTEAEFEKKQRLKSKERLNRITRVFGVLAILLLSLAGVFEPFFEMTFFGAIFTPKDHSIIWSHMEDLKIFDDWLKFYDPWLAKIGITVLMIIAVVFLVYFLTYTIVDLVDLCKTLFEAGRDLTRDLSSNVKDTMNLEIPEKHEQKKKPAKKNLFSGDDVKPEEKMPKERKERKPRRNESDATDLNGLTQDQLDRLLSGEPMDEVIKQEEKDYSLDLD